MSAWPPNPSLHALYVAPSLGSGPAKGGAAVRCDRPAMKSVVIVLLIGQCAEMFRFG